MFPRHAYTVPLAGGRRLDLGSRTLVMAIVNVTPDSFADLSPSTDPGRALESALRAEAEGADLIDVGAESTRPGAVAVDAAEERRRLVPALRAIAPRVRLPISVDTRRAEVARAAIAEGAAIVNDVSGLGYDAEVASVAAAAGAALVLMHTRGSPTDMYRQAVYADVMGEVARELSASVERAVAAGVAREALVLDPGIGFAKKAEHSYDLLARLPELAALGCPLLVGPSRKSFLQAALGTAAASDRDWGTAAAGTAAVLAGAHVVRVHAVGPMVQVVRVADEIRRHATS